MSTATDVARTYCFTEGIMGFSRMFAKLVNFRKNLANCLAYRPKKYFQSFAKLVNRYGHRPPFLFHARSEALLTQLPKLSTVSLFHEKDFKDGSMEIHHICLICQLFHERIEVLFRHLSDLSTVAWQDRSTSRTFARFVNCFTV